MVKHKTKEVILKELSSEFYMGSPNSKVNRECKTYDDLVLMAMDVYAKQSVAQGLAYYKGRMSVIEETLEFIAKKELSIDPLTGHAMVAQKRKGVLSAFRDIKIYLNAKKNKKQ